MPAPHSNLATQLPEGPLAVAVSGGVDSLAALLLSLESGRKVLAIHARMWRREESSEARACEQRLAQTVADLGCDFHLADLEKSFEESVVRPFVHAWEQGLTPNPCALCNRRIKFGALWEKAASLGAAALVTGHYARLDYNHPYRTKAPLLATAKDARKDQSYFLGLVQKKVLARVAFPLSSYTKDEVRALVAEIRKFIQTLGADFCFIGNQYRLIVGDEEAFIDLLFYHRSLRALVAIELKRGKFKPAYLGQLNYYLSALDEQERHSDENQSIGLLLCKEANQAVVELAIRDFNKPMGVAVYRTRNDIPEPYQTLIPLMDGVRKILTADQH